MFEEMSGFNFEKPALHCERATACDRGCAVFWPCDASGIVRLKHHLRDKEFSDHSELETRPSNFPTRSRRSSEAKLPRWLHASENDEDYGVD